MPVKLTLPIGNITRILILIAFFLAVQSITGKYVEDYVGENGSHFLWETVRLFNINRESSIPTWYASSLLLMAAGLLGLVAYTKRANREPYWRYWVGLAVIFMYLSIDEASAIHEIFTEPMQGMLSTSGPLYFAWLVVGIPLVGVFGLVYFRFWLNLPPRIRTLFFLAAMIYVGGAVGIEMIGSNKWYVDGGTSLLYSAIGTVEEFCEMLGVITLIYAVSTYLAGSAFALDVNIQAAEAQPQTAPAVAEKPRAKTPARNPSPAPVRWIGRWLPQTYVER